MPTHLFVYGTLMRGESRHRHLAGATFVGDACTQPEHRLFDVGEYPALVTDETGRPIAGEVWLVTDETLRVLDDVEGVDEGLYVRVPVRLQPPFDAVASETYIYRASVAGLAEIERSWRERQKRQE